MIVTSVATTPMTAAEPSPAITPQTSLPRAIFHTHFTVLDTALKKVDGALADQVGGGTASKAAILDAIRIDCRNIRARFK